LSFDQTTVLIRIALTPQENAMLSDLDVYRAAHLMLHQYGDDAELEAAQCFDRMLKRDDHDELLTWFRIWRTIAAMRQAPAGLPH
jgi:hypothetical protein